MNRTEENLKRIRAFSRDNEGVMAFDDWDESKHPRRPDGKFGSGGGAATKINQEAEKGKSSGQGSEADIFVDEKAHAAIRKGFMSAPAETLAAICKYKPDFKNMPKESKGSMTAYYNLARQVAKERGIKY